MRGLTNESGIASSVSTSASIGTDRRQKSSARSLRPSATSSTAVGIALFDAGSVRASAGSMRRPSFSNSIRRKSADPGFPS